MKVVILCGGLGTRLREETEFRPKPIVNIGNRPILWHIMKIYAQQGHKDFILNLGYKGEMIKEYFYNYKIMNNDISFSLKNPHNFDIHSTTDEDDWNITLADTGQNTLKGARISRIRRYIQDDTFMLTYGDGLCSIDIASLLSFHKSHGKIATMTGINPASRFGEMKLEGNMVKVFNEKPEQSSWIANGGFFVLNKEIFNYLNDNENCDFEIGCLEKLAREGQLMVYKHSGLWTCMDTIRDTEYLNNLWNTNNAFWKSW